MAATADTMYEQPHQGKKGASSKHLPLPERLAFSTLCIHADDGIEGSPDLAAPIHVSTTFESGNEDGLSYSRADCMTRRRLEAVLSSLEGGNGALAVTYASGMSAVNAVIQCLKPRRIVIDRHGYKGTHSAVSLFKELIDRGRSDGLVEILHYDSSFDSLERNDIVWIETPLNPTSQIYDIKKLSEMAHKQKAFVIVDSTFASPVLQRPLDHGADVVLHSTTKFMGGHSDLLGGVLISRKAEIILPLMRHRTTTGCTMGNLETWLLLRSLRTLPLRVKHQSRTAKTLAKWLEKNGKPLVKTVYHPSLKNSLNRESHDLCKKQMFGPPAIIAICMNTEKNAQKLPSLLKLFKDCTSLGGVESTIDLRIKWDQGVDPTLLRISVGVEEAVDLTNDFTQALKILKE